MAKYRNIVASAWLMVLLPVAVASAQPKPDVVPSADAPKVKPLTLQQLVKELSDEAEQALKERKPMPRLSSDYAITHADGELSDRDLMTGLTRPADRNPIIDSYIKWQLLSFKPDFAGMKSPDLMKVIDAIPAPQAAGQMEPRDLATVKAASKGGGSAAALKKILDDFNAQQKQIAETNKPNVAYRKAVFAAAAASSDKGMGLIAKVKEIELAIDGGEDRQVAALAKKLSEELLGLRADASLSGAMRSELSRRIGLVGKRSRDVIGSLNLKASGEVVYTEKTLTLSSTYVDQMQAYLAGREYTPKKK